MSVTDELVKKTIINLSEQSIHATPRAYAKEYCAIANSINLDIEECRRFKEVVQQLSDDEQFEVDINGIETFYDLIPLLLNRVSTDNLNNMATMISESLQPSISINLDEDLHKFSIKIGDSPELLFENDIQEEIKKFIEKRIHLDKNELNKKAKEIAQVITVMTKFLAEAINSSSQGSSDISDIAKDIELLDTSNPEHITVMQGKLINAAKSIETAISKNTDTLKSGQTKVQKLEEKIQELEKQLESSRKESEFDHLTGVLTRRAYDRYAQKIDDNYNRNNVDYAVIFFDIDHFKKVNDTYGHDAGDVILSTFAKVLQKSTRDLDVVGRYGGEEFIALVHFNDIEEISTYVSRVKSIVTNHKFKYDNLKIQITFSAGVTLRSENNSYNETIKKSDELLYQAKQTGRNKVIFKNGTII